MADQGLDTEPRRWIRLDDAYYERVSGVALSRSQRSKVSRFTGDDIKDMPEYRYEPLKSMRRRIRLLRLHGGGLSNPEIICELFEVEYDKDRQSIVRDDRGEEIEYEALSWCWGREAKDRAIMIQNRGEYFRLAVTRELSLALKYLRHRDKYRILWIDALCIDQENHEERNHQVQMMARIYNGATQACIWLGEDNDDSTKAIAFIQEIMKLENFDTVSEKKENASKWQSLLLLMQRPWFSRRWVVQEVALARAATIYCGTDKIPWENFAVAVELFVEVETATHRLSEVMRKDERFGHVPQWFEHVSELGASVLVEATGKIFRRDGTQRIAAADVARSRETQDGSQTQDSTGSPESPAWALQRPLLSLEYLVSSLTVFEASQPRDAVYSLLAISRDTAPFAEMLTVSQDGSEEAIIMSTVSSFLERKPFKVDYSRRYSEVCKDFISFCIRVSGKSDPSRALDILCRPWAPDPDVVSPSVGHKKPKPYKFLDTRDSLWHKRDKPPQSPVAAGNKTNDNTRQPQRKAKYTASTLRVDKSESMETYWDRVKEDRRINLVELKSSFERVVEPYLPNKVLGDRNADGRQGEPTTNGRGEAGDKQDAPDQDIELPSWVSRISGASFALYRLPGMHEGTRIGRQNADSLVGAPQDGHKTYSAAQNTKVDYKSLVFRKRPGLRDDPRSGHSSLYTEGFILAEVKAKAEPARLGSIPKTWTELAGWEGAMDGKTEPPAAFWRTLVGDRGKDHRNPPYYYATACKESVRKGGLRGGSVDTGALISKERNSIIAEFCRRVQAVIWNRRLIKTTIATEERPEALGLAGHAVQKGDLVCILFGCTVPVILRRSEKKREDEMRAEEMQDSIESMKQVLSMCEEACFRKNRYKKKLEEERKRELGEDGAIGEGTCSWKEEVVEEMNAVNKEMEEWKRRDKSAREQEQQLIEAQKQRGKEAESRRQKRERWKRKAPGSVTPNGPMALRTAATMPPQTSPMRTAFAPSQDPDEATRPESPHSNEREDAGGNPSHERQEKPVAAGAGTETSGGGTQQESPDMKQEDSKVWYKFIGEAYIHGMMDGEAIRLQINEGLRRRTFEIR